MSRLDESTERLAGAVERLEKLAEAKRESGGEEAVVQELREQLASAEQEREAMRQQIEGLIGRLDRAIEQLKNGAGD